MRILKKQLGYLLMFLLSFYVLCFAGFAAEVKVYDLANLFTLDEVDKLQESATSLAENYQMDIGIVTTDNANGKSAMEYADDFYDENDFGYGHNKDGLLLLIDMDNREIYISTCGLGIQYFTDLRISKMLDSAYNYISNGDYYNAATDFLKQVEIYLDKGIVSNQNTTQRPFSDPREDYNNPYMQEAAPEHKPFTTTSGEPLNAQSIILSVVVSLLGSFIIAIVIRTAVSYSYKNPHGSSPQTRPDDLSVHYTQKEDRFITSHTTRVKIQTNTNSGGSHGASGRSSTHHSSSGRSHGGGGRKF